MYTTPMRRHRRFDETSSTGETNHLLVYLSYRLLERCSDTPLKVGFQLMLDTGSLLELCSYDFRYDSLTVEDAGLFAQIKAFFSKRADLELGVDRAAVAARKFVEAEALCRETNEIFRLRACGAFNMAPRVESVLFQASRKISRILGDVPSLEDLHPRFGPGATVDLKKAQACPRNKLGSRFACSSELLPIVSLLLAEMPGWVEGRHGAMFAWPDAPAVVTQLGVVEFVPKSWKTDRAIVKEPLLNTMFQLGVGDYIAARLSKWGCDLETGANQNRDAARRGSQTGALATLDLSSASDTVAQALVLDLLPIDWVLFLRNFRTGSVLLNGQRIVQEKFSSMGNGFTFPLETLIFYALAKSVSDEAYVFGDDIIVETETVPLLLEVLTACGFLVNPEKSFVEGPFRESCGGDYLQGIDIRPLFVKDRVSCADLFVMHNFFVRKGDKATARILHDRISPEVRIYGPDGYGDGHLLREGLKLRPYNRKVGWSGYVFKTYVAVSPRSDAATIGDPVLPLYAAYVSCSLREPDASSAQFRLIGCNDPDPQGPGEFPKRIYGFSEAPARTAFYGREGELQVTLPGVSHYKVISVYTLNF